MNKEKMIRMVELTGAIRALLAAAIEAAETTVQKQEMLIGIRLLADMAAETADSLMMEEMNPAPAEFHSDTDLITNGNLQAYTVTMPEQAVKKPYPVGSVEAKQVIERVREEEAVRDRKRSGRPRKEN